MLECAVSDVHAMKNLVEKLQMDCHIATLLVVCKTTVCHFLFQLLPVCHVESREREVWKHEYFVFLFGLFTLTIFLIPQPHPMPFSATFRLIFHNRIHQFRQSLSCSRFLSTSRSRSKPHTVLLPSNEIFIFSIDNCANEHVTN